MFLRLKNERFLPLCSLSSQSLVGRDKQQQESPYLITRYVLALTKLRHCFLRCLYSVQRDARKDSELRNSKTVQMVKLGLTVDNNFRQILAARRHSGLSPPGWSKILQACDTSTFALTPVCVLPPGSHERRINYQMSLRCCRPAAVRSYGNAQHRQQYHWHLWNTWHIAALKFL